MAVIATLGLLENEYPNLNPRAIAVAEQIVLLLDFDCRKDGRASPSETGCCLSWVHRQLFCDVDSEDDDASPDSPIKIMIHKPHKSASFSWDDDVEYLADPPAAARRLMELWRK